MINFSVWVNMSDTEKLCSLITKNSKKVCLLYTKMKIILFNNFSFRCVLIVY